MPARIAPPPRREALRPEEYLSVRGAREHNLKGVNCLLPRNSLVVITGPSGSGKSSLAFDTIYAEGQRRYVESLSAYARQFLERLPKPRVDSIEGLSPAIAIEQKTLGKSPRSTVGTVTEIADYLRLLFARVGLPFSPISGSPLRSHTAQEVVDLICARNEGSRLTLLAPIARKQTGDLAQELEALRRDGYVRVQVDGVQRDLGDEISLDRAHAHDLFVIIDRIVVRPGMVSRVTDSVELALKLGNGTLLLDEGSGAPPSAFSESWINWEEGIAFPPLEPALFSFNSPLGCCQTCGGLGTFAQVDPTRLVLNGKLTLRQGALLPLGRAGSPAAAAALSHVVKHLGVDPDVAWDALPSPTRSAILSGEQQGAKTAYLGVLQRLQQRLDGADEDGPSDEDIEEGVLSAAEISRFVREQPCSACHGDRLRPEALAVRLQGLNMAELCRTPFPQLLTFFNSLKDSAEIPHSKQIIAEPLIAAITTRLRFLLDVGLGYLTLDRNARTLSGGEGQRIRLATQLGTSLVGVLYVLDEPSVGLHPRDNQRLLSAVRGLVNKGNSVLLVEHDRDAILTADYLVDMGPGAGEHGGRIVAQGPLAQVLRDPNSVSAPYLTGQNPLPTLPERKAGQSELRVIGARARNLKSITVSIPLGVLTAVTGVSGSGKSTLILDTLLPAARRHLQRSPDPTNTCDRIEGLAHLDRIVSVDQTPIGRTPRSNPSSFTGILSLLRDLYAALPEARARGYRAGRFSFNVKGGRCEACQGEGVLRVEMHFLPDLFVTCDSCRGARYNRETLEIRYRGYSIAELLTLTVDQASSLLASFPKIHERLTALQRLGLGYIQLGQPANTLSGGEAQRIKLATELSRPPTGRTLYLLDEPTTGLHFSDIALLLTALFALRDANNTVVVIEHNLDLIACADWVIDLGPDGGPGGGEIVTQGTPETVAKAKGSHTGLHLKAHLAAHSRPPPPRKPSGVNARSRRAGGRR